MNSIAQPTGSVRDALHVARNLFIVLAGAGLLLAIAPVLAPGRNLFASAAFVTWATLAGICAYGLAKGRPFALHAGLVLSGGTVLFARALIGTSLFLFIFVAATALAFTVGLEIAYFKDLVARRRHSL